MSEQSRGGDFRPPHVSDSAPLARSKQALARFYAADFRAAAGGFRVEGSFQFNTDRPDLKKWLREFCAFPTNLRVYCGVLLIEARDKGLIPQTERELLELIAWHCEPDRPKPEHSEAVALRCPDNLFLDVCGGHHVVGIFKGADDRGRAILDGMHECGGLMPRVNPRHLDKPALERYAATCEWLASLLERAADSEDDSAWVPAKMLLAGRFDRFSAITRALRDNPQIRTRKPSPQRLEVHAGDWTRFLAQQSADALDFEASVVDSVLEFQQRRAEIDREKRRK